MPGWVSACFNTSSRVSAALIQIFRKNSLSFFFLFFFPDCKCYAARSSASPPWQEVAVSLVRLSLNFHVQHFFSCVFSPYHPSSLISSPEHVQDSHSLAVDFSILFHAKHFSQLLSNSQNFGEIF